MVSNHVQYQMMREKNRSITKTIICAVLMAAIVIVFCGHVFEVESYSKRKANSEETQKLIQDMGVGINIGNTLDACNWNAMFTTSSGNSTETSWGNPAITEQYIQTLKNSGFKTVRVPVTFMNHIDGAGNVDRAWLDRVAQVVNVILARDMYCIIDIHHDTGDGGWIKATSANYDANKDRVANMITQIATYFRDYPDKLILEGFNEMNDDKNHWDGAPVAAYKAYNKWIQLFVDKVRETGGNNASRYLLINTYAATFKTKTRKCFELPRDSANNKLLVGVHNYTGLDGLEESFGYINKLADEGYPIVIGEFGATAAASFDRAEYASKMMALCRSFGYCPIWWDNGVKESQNKKDCFIIIDRKSCEPIYGNIIEALTK
ncbi:glycoside hydrolase family 5 protein [Butyrivibrio sp. XPD2006]|uniref:glycoside hydrolase family 5 protein n=1 Tax=Butyrivibrio sp. XPD2006 TaxID=1280668 RepID=UPI0003F9E428|nr:glycoside hydrolase family 5 protein [Butyrivibrio sp. XPD2006]